MEALSDGQTTSQLIKIAYIRAKRGAKTYLYHFAHQSNQGKETPDHPQRIGTMRGEELAYLFGLPMASKHTDANHAYTKQDVAVSETVVTYFTNYCKTGDPNDPGKLKGDSSKSDHSTRYRNLVWHPYDRTAQQYLSFAAKPKMKSHYRGHKMALWLNLIPQLHVAGGVDIAERHHQFNESDIAEYFGK